MALIDKGVSVMKKTREASDEQISIAEKRNLVAAIAASGATHIEITMFAHTNADLIAHSFTPGPYNSIEAETQEWYDVAHAQPNIYGPSVNGGYMRVIDRAIRCDIEGIQNFSIVTGRSIGTAASAPTDGYNTWTGIFYEYLENNVGFSRLRTGDIFMPIPEITGHLFGGSPFTNQAGAINLCNQLSTLTTNLNTQLGITMRYYSNPNFSEVSSGYWSGYATQGNVVCFDYYGNARNLGQMTPDDYYYELSEIYAGRSLAGYGISTGGKPQFVGEWGDLSGALTVPGGVRTGDNWVTGTTNLDAWVQEQRKFFRVMRTLVNEGKVVGFNWWGGWENQNTSIFYKTGSGESSQYFPNWRGQMLGHFFRGESLARNPVIPNGTYSEANPSFGGRQMYY